MSVIVLEESRLSGTTLLRYILEMAKVLFRYGFWIVHSWFSGVNKTRKVRKLYNMALIKKFPVLVVELFTMCCKIWFLWKDKLSMNYFNPGKDAPLPQWRNWTTPKIVLLAGRLYINYVLYIIVINIVIVTL